MNKEFRPKNFSLPAGIGRYFSKIGGWLWLKKGAISPPTHLEIIVEAINHSRDHLKSKKIEWEEEWKILPLGYSSQERVFVKMNEDGLALLHEIKGILMTNLSGKLARYGKGMTTNMALGYCLERTARTLEFNGSASVELTMSEE